MYNYVQQPDVDERHLQRQLGDHDGGGMYNYSQQPDADERHLQRQLGRQLRRRDVQQFGSSPTLTNVTFSGNSATSDGGGMYNYSTAARR